MRYLTLLLLALVAAAPANQKAIDDLAAYYANPRAIPITKLVTDLGSPDPAVRANTGKYLVDLLQQSHADEESGRAVWLADATPIASPLPPAAQLRGTLAAGLREDAATAEALDAVMWLIQFDPSADDQEAAAAALGRIESPQLAAALGKLLAPPHGNKVVVMAAVSAAGARKLAALAPAVLALSNEPREDVREAARAAAEQLGLKDIPPFDPAKALSTLDGDLKAIAKMVFTPIPADAKWQRFTVRVNPARPATQPADGRAELTGWLLGEDQANIRMLDLFGQERRLPRANTTRADRTLADDAKAMVELRGAGDNTARAALSWMGRASAQFEPDFVSLPEVLLAAWAYERGQPGPAAEVLLPRLDAVRDRTWIRLAARDLLAKLYQQQMLDTFTGQRDYAQTLRLARHLTGDAFAGWVYVERTRELAAQLEKRSEDFKTLTLPAPTEWARMQTTLDRPGQIQYLTRRLRLLNAFQDAKGLDFHMAQTRQPRAAGQDPGPGGPAGEVINPLSALEGMSLEVKDIPALVPALDDENYVLACGYTREFHPDRALYRVNMFIGGLINTAACRPLVDYAAYGLAEGDGRLAVRRQIEQWVSANAGKTRIQLLVENGEAAKTFTEVRAIAQELARMKEPAALTALTALLKRMTGLVKPEERAYMAEWCLDYAPAQGVEPARLWLAEKGEVRFWAALILLTAGDKARLEGLPELKTALAGDDPGLRLHRRALPLLLATGRDEAAALACSALERIKDDLFPSLEEADIVHALLIGKRPEALKFLTDKLADSRVIGPITLTWQGQETRVAWTRGDWAGVLIQGLRTDNYRYPSGAPDAQRETERQTLKAWLTAQFDLIRAGKTGAIRP